MGLSHLVVYYVVFHIHKGVESCVFVSLDYVDYLISIRSPFIYRFEQINKECGEVSMHCFGIVCKSSLDAMSTKG